ncbi:MAG: hypothetical protein WC043_08905 [Pseudobdellovibrionaceae bacterium]
MNFKKIALWILLILASSGAGKTTHAAESWCKTSNLPKINIKTSTNNITYNYSKSEKDLNQFTISTVNPYGDNVITDVGGLMQGGIETTQNMNYGTLTNRISGQVCYWINSIDVLVHISPTIYIASNFPQGSCMHTAIMNHEQKHIVTDRLVVNKYAQQMGAALQQAVNTQYVFGPVPAGQQADLQKAIGAQLQAVLKTQMDAMKTERMQRQQAIDSLSEYESVQRQCKNKR